MLATYTCNVCVSLCFTLQDINKISIKTAGKAFLLTWKFFTSKIVREFTLMSAPSFGKAKSPIDPGPHNMTCSVSLCLSAGTFHLLHMLVDDYIMHTLETMLEKEHEEFYLKRINMLRYGTLDLVLKYAQSAVTKFLHLCEIRSDSSLSLGANLS